MHKTTLCTLLAVTLGVPGCAVLILGHSGPPATPDVTTTRTRLPPAPRRPGLGGPHSCRVDRNADDRRDDLFDVIVAYKRANDGRAPSIREMIDETDYRSASSVVYALRRLQAQGRIELGEGARNIRVVGATWSPPAGEAGAGSVAAPQMGDISHVAGQTGDVESHGTNACSAKD